MRAARSKRRSFAVGLVRLPKRTAPVFNQVDPFSCIFGRAVRSRPGSGNHTRHISRLDKAGDPNLH